MFSWVHGRIRTTSITSSDLPPCNSPFRNFASMSAGRSHCWSSHMATCSRTRVSKIGTRLSSGEDIFSIPKASQRGNQCSEIRSPGQSALCGACGRNWLLRVGRVLARRYIRLRITRNDIPTRINFFFCRYANDRGQGVALVEFHDADTLCVAANIIEIADLNTLDLAA